MKSVASIVERKHNLEFKKDQETSGKKQKKDQQKNEDQQTTEKKRFDSENSAFERVVKGRVPINPPKTT